MGEFDQTIGFPLMGVIINTYLTGVIMAQFSTYLTHYLPGYKDPLCLVAFLFVINISHAGAVAYMAWFYCVTNFANPHIVSYNLWVYPFTSLTTAILAITNQMFQTWKIYLFTRNKIFVVFLTAASLAACGVGLTVAVKSWFIVKMTKLHVIQSVMEANLALQCVVDVIIASTLTWTFCKSKTSFAHTDRALNRLIRTAVQSGSFTAFLALGTLFSVRFSSKANTLTLFVLPIGRIYTQTIMDHFVYREQFQPASTNNGDTMSIPHFHIRSAGSNGSSGVIESISLRSTQTPVPKVSKGLHAESCGDLSGC
ncbi:hypothetical protein C8R45DRAFT_1073285 [Mycena sanguinolenta]|nr:hypothetical protein C8R45DRAFT_1073285 [Mycena sanguinolenta]